MRVTGESRFTTRLTLLHSERSCNLLFTGQFSFLHRDCTIWETSKPYLNPKLLNQPTTVATIHTIHINFYRKIVA
jgi:hypothetical protein